MAEALGEKCFFFSLEMTNAALAMFAFAGFIIICIKRMAASSSHFDRATFSLGWLVAQMVHDPCSGSEFSDLCNKALTLPW